MTPTTFLRELENVKTGDGVRRDELLSLRDAYLFSDGSSLTTTLTTNPGYAALETNAMGLSWAATKVVAFGIALVLPGDYDESKDEIKLRMEVQSAGATDTPALTVNVYRKRAGAALSADLGPFTAKNVGETANFAAAVTSAIAVVNVSGKTCKAGDILFFKVTPAAHGTDALNIYKIVARYRGDVVLYDETVR